MPTLPREGTLVTNLVRVVWLAAALVLLAPVSASAATIGQLIPGHSHWDVKNVDHQLQVCYTVMATPTTGAGSTIAFIPHREVDSQNFMQLDITKTGFRLKRRVASVFTTVTPDPAVPTPVLTLGTVGQDIMFQYEMRGADFYLYQLLPDLTRGALWYHWYDTTYPSGVNISYYTQPHWFGSWDFVHGKTLDGIGWPHEITGLAQDARNHPAIITGQNTFDSTTPASGGVTGVNNSLGGSPTFGLASGANYTYTINVAGTGSGSFDFRDPAVPENVFWGASFYRLKVGTSATIQRFNGATAGATYTATQGGPGSYTLTLTGADMNLSKAGIPILHVNDGGPQSGVRVRIIPSTQTWSWTGKVG